MKTIIINASPRKNWNTATLLNEAKKGVESTGSEVEYIDLYDLSYTGCRSCLACKLKDGKHPGCAWNDDLSPLIDRILAADSLIIGTPIYWAEPTAQFRALLERLVFCTIPYQLGSYFEGKVNTALIYTMNAPQDYYDHVLRPYLTEIEDLLKMALHGDLSTYAAFDTTMVTNYAIYDMGMFDPEEKKEYRDKHFPIDMEECFKLGVKMGQ